MSDLHQIAEQARKDADRAQSLRIAIQTMGDNADGTLMRVTVEFIGDRNPEAGQEVVRTIKGMWPAIWEDTMRASADELQKIEARYAHLKSEVPQYVRG